MDTFERHPPSRAAEGLAADTPADWAPFFDAASIEAAQLVPATPSYHPHTFADSRHAWTGTWTTPGLGPGQLEAVLRVEAGTLLGQPVYFKTFGPWTRLDQPSSESGSTALVAILASLIVPGMLVAAGLVARTNLAHGRGDRAGAWRLAALLAFTSLAGWVFSAHHVLDLGVEQGRLFSAIGHRLFDGAVIWIFYLAAEPYVRKTWPHILITWSRLIGGRFRDALVGRDLLVGATAGAAMTIISYGFHLVPGWFAWPPFAPHTPAILLGTRPLLALMCVQLAGALSNAMLGVLGLALLRSALLRVSPLLNRTWIAFAVATLLFTPLAASGQFQSGLLGVDLAFGLMLVLLILGVIFRYGLFAGVAGFFAHFWTWNVAVTLDPQRPYFDTGLIALGLVAAIAVTGFVLARRSTVVGI
jgi:serine/threonine-protein kinase